MDTQDLFDNLKKVCAKNNVSLKAWMAIEAEFKSLEAGIDTDELVEGLDNFLKDKK